MAPFRQTVEAQIKNATVDQESRLPKASITDAKGWAGANGFKIKDPLMLLHIYDPYIRDHDVKVHTWQIQVMTLFAHGKLPDKVLRIATCANNGSGKSQFLIAPCAVWLAMAHVEANCVITSASGTQLDRQTFYAVSRLCRFINELHGEILWKINYRSLTFIPTKSKIQLFATDDAGLAEGYHTLRPDGEFAIFVDEAKTVTEPIFEALARCNNLTRRLDVSSPGSPSGHFYGCFESERWHRFKVTYRDCPHISQDEVDEARERFGENSAWFRSAYLAEFCSIDEMLVMTFEEVMRAYRKPPVVIPTGIRYGGLDLAAGGDENVFSIFDGNKQIAMPCFRYDDTTDAVDHVKGLINRYKIPPENINADDGGVGKSMIDQLWKDGFQVNRVLNQARAIDNSTYGNRGAEMWFNFAIFLKNLDLVLFDDDALKRQLATRYYMQGAVHGKIVLESKRVARAKGHGSPDRADGTVLALADKEYPLYSNEHLVKNSRLLRRRTTKDIIAEYDKSKYSFSGVDARGESRKSAPVYGYMGATRN